jgi:hypothetical protein
LGDWERAILSPLDAFPRAKAAATKALALDDSLSEAHTSLAFIEDLLHRIGLPSRDPVIR